MPSSIGVVGIELDGILDCALFLLWLETEFGIPLGPGFGLSFWKRRGRNVFLICSRNGAVVPKTTKSSTLGRHPGMKRTKSPLALVALRSGASGGTVDFAEDI